MAVSYFNTSSTQPDSLKWYFEGGEPQQSAESNPVVQYSTPGEFDCQIIIWKEGQSDTLLRTDYILIKDIQPSVGFAYERTGLSLSFTNNSENATDFAWDFGDYSFSTESAPLHTYDREDTYIVRLKATNQCGSISRSDIIVLDCCDSLPSYTANDRVTPYSQGFRPGTNLGYFPPWSDAELADIAAGCPEKGVRGAGAKSIRPSLVEHFLDQYGYDARYTTYLHYDSLGLKDNTAIIGFPSDRHRDTTHYCTDYQSEHFANLYTPIWDNGENGTPYNDTNYLAAYLYRAANLYKPFIKYWEVWNEPGFDFTNVTGWLAPGFEGNWWENDPDPCDYKLRAPIQHYVRTLRIAYEVIKTVDPDAYVTLASVGFTSFLDAILRNTDNPDGGQISPQYPLQGGAYFDAIATHSYPHFDGTLRQWNPATMAFDQERHTDKAAQGLVEVQDTFQKVLDQYGYDGLTYPKKEWIITEINIPRKSFQGFIGSDETQVNFIIKAYVNAVRQEIRQMHIYDLAETFEFEDAVNEFQLMGLYKRLFETFPYGERANDLAIAYKTTSDLLFGNQFDSERTSMLELPDSIDGAAFLGEDGFYTYVLWAKTQIDNSEEANALYSFPPELSDCCGEYNDWRYADGAAWVLNSSASFALSGSPLFIRFRGRPCPNETDCGSDVYAVAPTALFDKDIARGCAPFEVQFSDKSLGIPENYRWEFEGGQPFTSTEPNPVVRYEDPGTYQVKLVVENAQGQDSLVEYRSVIVSEDRPNASFSSSINDFTATFNNASLNANAFCWNPGTNQWITEAQPTITYPIPGFFDITLVAKNECGTDTSTSQILIRGDLVQPIPDFIAIDTLGCAPFVVQYLDKSSDNTVRWDWFFDGGSPSSSSEQNPVVTYNDPGVYFVNLVTMSQNQLSATAFKGEYITVLDAPAPAADFDFLVDQNRVSFYNQSQNGRAFYWEFGDGSSSDLRDPFYTYSDTGTYTVRLIVENECDQDTLSKEIIITELLVTTVESPISGPTFTLAPNPASGMYSLYITGNQAESTEAIISNADGKIIKELKVRFGQNTLIDIRHMPDGIYTLTWQYDSGSKSVRLVKTN